MKYQNIPRNTGLTLEHDLQYRYVLCAPLTFDPPLICLPHEEHDAMIYNHITCRYVFSWTLERKRKDDS